jgi:cell division protease FtsH
MNPVEAVRSAVAKLRARVARYSTERPQSFRMLIAATFTAILALGVTAYVVSQPDTMGITTFLERVTSKQVSHATVVKSLGGFDITARVGDETFFVKSPSEPIVSGGGQMGRNILQTMAANGVEVELVNGLRNSIMLMFAFAMPFILVAVFGFMGWQAVMGSNSTWMHSVRGVKTRFSDVAGADEAKAELSEVLHFLKGADAYKATGARIPRGVLLAGPPGTGKTLLARALAGEAEATFVAVSGSDFKSMWLGGSARRVRTLFSYARQNAPCIVFIDEFDAIGAHRTAGTGATDREMNGTLNQLLVEMDGFSKNEGILVVAATNLRQNLDPAVVRPGRLDRIVDVGLPDQSGRAQILKLHAVGRPLEDGVDLAVVARGTPGFSGADLENLVNEAAVMAARRASTTVAARDFESARNKILMGVERRTLVLTEDDRRLAAVHEAGHAVAACRCPGSDPVHKATIVPHGRALGMVVRLPERERMSVTVSKLRDELTVLMAGRAAEHAVFGADSVTTGAASDIEQATALARSMVVEWGLGERVGMVRVSPERAVLDAVVEDEVRAIVHAAYKRAFDLVETERPALDRIADALFERETLEGAEIRALARSPEPVVLVAA